MLRVRSLRAPLVLAALPLVFASVARAEDAEDDVTVHGSQAAGTSSRAKLDDAAREVTNAAGLVETLPGVHVRRLGGDDGFATLSIRGASSAQTAIVLAGVPLSGGGTPVVDLSSLPLWPGVQARVYRTFAPASLGPGSLGGTLSWDPPSARGPERTEAWTAVGSFGALRLRAGTIRAIGTARLATGVSASRSDGDFPYANIRFGSSDPRETLVRENAGHAQGSAIASLVVPFRVSGDREGSVKVLALAQARRQSLPGSVFAATPRQRLETDRELWSAEVAHPATRTVSAYTQWWGRHEGLSLRDSPERPALDPSRADGGVAAFGGAVGVRGRPLRAVRGDVRLEGRGERFVAGRYVGPTPQHGATRSALAAAADLDAHPAPPLTLHLTGRVEHLRDDTAGDARETTLGTAHAGVELAGRHASVAVHAGTLSRAPSFFERFGITGGTLPTPELRPESAWSVDVALRAKAKLRSLQAHATASGFATAASDLIVFVPVGVSGAPKAENIGAARLAGLEVEAGAKRTPVELRVSYTLLGTVNDARCAPGCPPLPGRPVHDLVADAMVDLGPFVRARWGLDVVAGMRFDEAGTIAIPARAFHSAGLRFSPTKELSWSLDVRNIFDARTGTYDGFLGPVTAPLGDAYYYPLPGRTVLLTFRVTASDAP